MREKNGRLLNDENCNLSDLASYFVEKKWHETESSEDKSWRLYKDLYFTSSKKTRQIVFSGKRPSIVLITMRMLRVLLARSYLQVN
jgi:hypothetical protein